MHGVTMQLLSGHVDLTPIANIDVIGVRNMSVQLRRWLDLDRVPVDVCLRMLLVVGREGELRYNQCLLIKAGQVESQVLSVDIDPGDTTCLEINTDDASMQVAEYAEVFLSREHHRRAYRRRRPCNTMRLMSGTPPAVSTRLLRLFFSMVSIVSTKMHLSFGSDASRIGLENLLLGFIRRVVGEGSFLPPCVMSLFVPKHIHFSMSRWHINC